MTPPNIAHIAAEIRCAHDTLATMAEQGDFDDCDFSVCADMLALVEKLDAWAAALGLVGVER